MTSIQSSSPDSHLSMYKNVYIYFPKSRSEPYEMSVNDAKQSRFVAIQLDFFENNSEDIEENNFDYYEIIVPDSLYSNVRQVDLNKFIELWLGTSSLFHHNIQDDHKYNYISITKIIGSMCMNKELKFVQILEDYYKI